MRPDHAGGGMVQVTLTPTLTPTPTPTPTRALTLAPTLTRYRCTPPPHMACRRRTHSCRPHRCGCRPPPQAQRRCTPGPLAPALHLQRMKPMPPPRPPPPPPRRPRPRLTGTRTRTRPTPRPTPTRPPTASELQPTRRPARRQRAAIWARTGTRPRPASAYRCLRTVGVLPPRTGVRCRTSRLPRRLTRTTSRGAMLSPSSHPPALPLGRSWGGAGPRAGRKVCGLRAARRGVGG